MGEAGHLIEEFPKSSESYQGTHASIQETGTEELSLNKRGAPPRPHRQEPGKFSYRPRIRPLALGQRAVSGLTAFAAGGDARPASQLATLSSPAYNAAIPGQSRPCIQKLQPATGFLSAQNWPGPAVTAPIPGSSETSPAAKGTPFRWVEYRQPRMRPAAVSLRRPPNHSGESPVVTGSGLEIGTGTGNR